MKGALATAFLAAFLGAGLAWAAPSDPAPPPPPPSPDQSDRPPLPPDRDRDRDHRPHSPQPGNHQPGFFPHEGGEHGDSFRHLSEEDRQKVRKAFEKAWHMPEVMDARDQLMKANDQYREALHHALQEADPEVVKILEKSKSDGPPGRPRPNSQPMPDPADPEFAHKVVQRLAGDLQGWLQQPFPEHGEHMDRPDRSEHREPAPTGGRLHERLMQAPAIRDALKDLEQSDPAHRMEAWKHLRDAYQSAAKVEIAKLREGQHPELPPRPPGGSPSDGAPPRPAPDQKP